MKASNNSNELVNGVVTKVIRTEPVIDGIKYYYYETMGGQFVSAGIIGASIEP